MIQLTKVGENTTIKGKTTKPYDEHTWKLLNILLGNKEEDTIIEIGFPYPEFLFEQNTIIAFGGAEVNASLGDRTIKDHHRINVKKGEKLKFEESVDGNIIYLACKGGFPIELEGKPFEERTEIKIEELANYNTELGVSRDLRVSLVEDQTLRIFIPKTKILTDTSLIVLENEVFKSEWEEDFSAIKLAGSLLSFIKPKSKVKEYGKGDLFVDEEGVLCCALKQGKSAGIIGKMFELDVSRLVQANERSNISLKVSSTKETEKEEKGLKKQLFILKASVKFNQI